MIEKTVTTKPTTTTESDDVTSTTTESTTTNSTTTSEEDDITTTESDDVTSTTESITNSTTTSEEDDITTTESTTTTEKSSCPCPENYEDWVADGDFCFKMPVDAKGDFDQLSNICQTEHDGGYLPVISNAEVNEAITIKLKSLGEGASILLDLKGIISQKSP